MISLYNRLKTKAIHVGRYISKVIGYREFGPIVRIIFSSVVLLFLLTGKNLSAYS